MTSRPEYFRPLAEGAAAMRERYLSVPSLAGSAGWAGRERPIGRGSPNSVEPRRTWVRLPIDGRTRYGAMIFDRATAQPLGVLARERQHRL